MSLIDKIVIYYKKNNYPISTGFKEINICYLEGCNAVDEIKLTPKEPKNQRLIYLISGVVKDWSLD